MGYLRRHAIVISGDEELVIKAHTEIMKISDMNNEDGKPVVWVSPFSPPLMNREYSFFVSPDGSKEGWTTSIIGDNVRDKIKEYLRTLYWCDGSTSIHWVEVQFGDDENETKVIASSDEDSEKLND